MKKVLLIDGNSIMNRAFYGLLNAGLLRAQDGTYTNAIYGFLNIFFKAVEDYSPEYIGVAFDKGKKTIRHREYDEYKAGRHKMPDELRMQMPIIKEIIEAMNIPYYEMDDYEADDILGTIAKTLTKKEDVYVYILTGDRDYFQLIDDRINIIYPKTEKNGSKQELWNINKVYESYDGLSPKDLIELKAIMGDKSDNIPGIRGIGEKTGIKLLKEYKDLEGLYEKAEKGEDNLSPKQKEKILEDKELAFLSRKLGTIIIDIDFKFTLEDLKKEKWSKKVKEIFIKLNLKSFLSRFDMLNNENLENGQDEENFEIKIAEDFNLLKNEKKIYIYPIFDDEIIKYDEKGKKIKPKEENVMDRKLTYLSIYLEQEEKICVLKFENKEENVSFFEKDKKNDIKILKDIMENENIKKISFGMKDFLVSLKKKNINAENILDLKLGEYLIDTGINKYNLEDTSSKYVKPEIIEKFLQNKKYGSYIIFKMFNKIIDKIKEENLENVFYEIEMPILKIIVNMTYLGIKINSEKIIKFGKELEKEIDELTKEIYELAGEEFNINSPKQLGEILFEKLNLEVIKKTKTGYSTDIKILEKLLGKHKIIEKIISYRSKSKLLSTYVDGFLPYVNKNDSRVHGRFHQTVTRTGRISSSDPNLQNIPIRTEQGKILRESFVPKDGYVFVDSDYSQIELRVLAHISNDQTMIKAFNEGKDIHRKTAANIFGKNLEDVTKEERSKAKAVNFGIIYGISSYGLSEQIKVSIPEAQKYIDEYLSKYSGIKEYMENIQKIAKEKGYVETIFGRRRYIEEINSNNFKVREFGKRAAMNAPIQGTAADIVKLAMINVSNRLKKENLDANILLQIHDEILIEVKKGQEEKAAKILKEEMENITKLKVPLVAETSIGNNWLM